MEPALQFHQPSERVKARARAAGIDLEALRRDDPQRYKMLNAAPVVTVHQDLAPMASDVFFAAFRHYALFQQAAAGAETTLLSFPPLEPAELSKLDDGLYRLAALEANRRRYAYYRVVSDAGGEHRQLSLPLSPEAWQGQAGVLVGPFEDQAAAERWAEARLGPDAGLIGDAVPHLGRWFSDVFAGSL